MVVKKYLIWFKSLHGALAVLGVVVITGASLGILANNPASKTAGSPPQVKSAVTDNPDQAASPPAAQTAGSKTSSPTSSPTASPISPKVVNPSPAPAGPSPPQTPSPSTPSPSPSPLPTISSIYLGQPYFDDNKGPIVTFTVPVTISGSGNVTIGWVQDGSGTTVCSTTVAFAANESKEVHCTASIPTPPHGVWGTATAGTVYAKTATLVYIGGTSWE